MNIAFNDLGKQWLDIKDCVELKLNTFFLSGNYIDGPYLHEFEKNFAEYTESEYAIGISNGTDALKLAIQAFKLSGKINVIIPANTYIADIIAVSHQLSGDHHIALIDCDEYFQIDLNLLEKHLINNRQKYNHTIIIPVHLYGHPVDMIRVQEFAYKYDCKILEDASQAHGARFKGEMIGKRSDMCVYSLYPGKALGAIGDAGVITTNRKEYSDRLKSIRNYGSTKKYYYDEIGWNNRMDPIQGIFLNEKLKFLDKWNSIKEEIASKYNTHLENIAFIKTPRVNSYVDKHVYHIYCLLVENRDELQKHLNSKGIPTVIHYPIPIQKTTPYLYLDNEDNKNTISMANKLLSLPMHPYLTDNEINYICDAIKEFYK